MEPCIQGPEPGAEGHRQQHLAPWEPQWDLRPLFLAGWGDCHLGQASFQEQEKHRELFWELVKPGRRLLGLQSLPLVGE